MPRRLNAAVNIEDLRRLAHRRVPRPVIDLVEGAAEDEITLRSNMQAYAKYKLYPRPFADIDGRDPSITLFGTALSNPIVLAPTGAARVLHRDAEVAVARAACSRGVTYAHSAIGGFSLEKVAEVSDRTAWLQLYLGADRDRVRADLARAIDSGYEVLLLTVDFPVFGNRERDRHNHLTLPIRPTPRVLASCVGKPLWSFDLIRGNLPQHPASHGRVSPFVTQRQLQSAFYPVRPRDLDFIRGQWPGRMVVKGIMHPDDADLALTHGADGVVVSNHGGRQLDRSPASLDVLPAVVDTVAGRAPVLVDGGIRRGTDVVTALALGASAVLVGRPYLYGLAAGGQAGVERMLDILTVELDRTMALVGCRTLADISREVLVPTAAPQGELHLPVLDSEAV